jgi:hypothetical protein
MQKVTLGPIALQCFKDTLAKEIPAAEKGIWSDITLPEVPWLGKVNG